MKRQLITLLVSMTLSQLHGQVTEKSPCAYVADPAYIKLRLDRSSDFSRRLDFVKKSSKAERANWGSLRMEKGRFVPVPRNFANMFPSGIIEKQDLEQIAKAVDKIVGSFPKVPVVAHIVRRSNGTGGLSEADLRASIDRANVHFIQASMQLELCAVRYIDSDRFFGTYFDDDSSDARLHTAPVLDVKNRNVAGKLNVYCVPNASTSWAWRPNRDANMQHILFRNDHVRNESTFSHEVGHWFGLMHTHGGSTSELVNGSNCGTEGDLVCDTPADPNISGQVNSSCAYTGTATDRNGNRFAPDPANLLSYAPKICRTRFTPDQVDIMQSVYFGVAEERGFSFSPCMKTYCFNLQLKTVKALKDGSNWRVRITGNSRDLFNLDLTFSFAFDSESEANQAIQAFNAKPTLDLCVLSGTNLYYFLHNGSAIDYPATRSFLNFDPEALSVEPRQDGRFQLGRLGLSSESFNFATRDDAEQALFSLRRYRFKKACFTHTGTMILCR